MLANVFTKTTRDRLPAGLIGALVAGLMLLFGMWVYQGVDTSFYYELPSAVLDLMGINPEGSGAGELAFGAIYNMMGAFIVAGIAITIGASSIAGEETQGTFGFLLGNPVSRRGVLLSKTGAMILVLTMMGLVLWGSGMGSASVLDVDTAALFVGAMTFALTLNGLFYGFLAMAIGAWTGNRGVASGVSAAAMIVGYLAANLLPLANAETAAKFSPWYYYNGSDPLNNGLDIAHVAVLVGLSVVCFAAAWVGLQRRDLREKGTNRTMLDRLRDNPMTQKVIERLAGSARVSRISMKTISEFQGLFVVTGAIVFYMGLLEAPLYNFIPDDFIDVFASFPDALVAMIGGVDMSTPEGFLTGEIFSLVGPISIIVLATAMGSRALAGEEEKHTMGLLLSNPITRSHLIFEKVQAMVVYALMFAAVTFLGTWIGVRIAGLDQVGVEGIASISALLGLFGLVFGGVALLFSAATGRRGVATMATTGVAIAAWFMFSFFPLSDRTEAFASWSPFHWYLGNDPLLNGMDWTGAALLVGAFAILVILSLPLFQRRDLRG